MPQDFDINRFKATYFEECYELLQIGEESLQTLKENLTKGKSVDVEALHALFRGVHSIKGGGGAFDFENLVKFTHDYETLLDKVRDIKIPLTVALLDLMYQAHDMLDRHVRAAQAETDLPFSQWQELIEKFKAAEQANETDPGDAPSEKDPFVQETPPSGATPDVQELPPHKWVEYNKTAQEEEAQGWGLYLDEEALNDLLQANASSVPQTEAVLQVEVAPTDEAHEHNDAVPLEADKNVEPTEVETETPTDLNESPEPLNEPLDDISLDQDVLDPRTYFKITFVPDVHLLKFANEPLLLVRELKTLGTFQVEINLDRLPCVEDMKSDEAYFSWIFHLKTDHPRDDILEVFDFVIDDCHLIIEEGKHQDWPASHNQDDEISETQVRKSDPPEEPEFSQGPEFSKRTEGQPEPDHADLKTEPTPPQTSLSSSTLPLSEPVEEENAPFVKKAQDKVSSHPDLSDQANAKLPRVSSIRVDLDRVDHLVNMVGELVITQAMLREQVENLGARKDQHVNQRFDELNAHTRDLQAGVMAIRMQPVKTVFARLPRLVRELSSKLNKDVDLITSGEMTEVDKTVIEQLMDPLTHMIRNALDHGIEPPEIRRANNKPEKATIHLSAEHRSGRIQIEISDDGGGIDRELVYQKALEKGLIRSEDHLNDQEIDELIFEPGFSTSKIVSDVSGRGVGMDVVSKNLTNLGGRIGVYSTPGKGTSFILSLPLTLAVMDGMIVRCGSENYIIPLTSVLENIRPAPEELKTLVTGKTVLSLQGSYIPLIMLHHLFGIQDAIDLPHKALIVIVETEQYGHVGIVVDELIGQQQIVIKSLEENYDPIAGVAAATILGTGKVSLILDVDGLAAMEQGSVQRKNFKKITQSKYLKGEEAHGKK